MLFFCENVVYPQNEPFAFVSTNNLTIQQAYLTCEVKTYTILGLERIYLFGAKERKFITPNFYWGEAGYGAISGKRSGYLEGGIICGYQSEILKNWLVDFRLFTGAGGGGSAPQGGGLIVNPTLGVGYRFTPQHTFFLEIGYIRFLNGDIESITFAMNLNQAFWRLQ